VFFFFFKQKTAYEIGLGIPAEPLFRSDSSEISESVNFCVMEAIKMIGVSNLQSFIASMTQKLTLSDISDESKNYLDKAGITTACLRIKSKWTRSEERRVGKECRYRWRMCSKINGE